MNYESDFLIHYGVPGQKWGVRRYQNTDGSLTNEGRQHYGYKGDKTGRFNDIKRALQRRGSAAVSKVRTAATKQKDSLVRRHKPVSMMSDQELRERTARLQAEANYQRLQNEMTGKNKPKRSFGEKHPIIKQIAITTAVTTAANLVGQQLNTKADEMLARKRMERAKEKGMLDKDLFPFVSNKNASRISAYNNSEKAKAEAEAKVLERIKDAESAVRQTEAKNTENAIKTALKWEREANKHNAGNAAFAANAQTERKIRDALAQIRQDNKSQRNAKAKAAVKSATDQLLEILYGKKKG